MQNYTMITELTDFGPYVTKLILELPVKVNARDLDETTFHVYAECMEGNGQIVRRKDRKTGAETLMKGYPKVLQAYPCDKKGTRCEHGQYAALELAEEYLNKRIAGDLLSSRWLANRYRVTQLRDLYGEDGLPENGLVFDQCAGDLCPGLENWSDGVSSHAQIPLHYGFYDPHVQEKAPLVVWLHGAGEGGTDPKIAYTGNRVTAISSPDIQRKLGGAAWVLVPQSPTVWMDDGAEKLGRSNRSIYTEPLMYLIREFMQQHLVDEKRIYIGGLSNGGFMTIRMLADYPGFFAGAIAVCAPFYEENVTEEVLRNVKDVPLWFVHCKTDTIVPPLECSIPLYRRLKEAGAQNVHFSLFDKLIDLSGRYREPDGRPREYFGHGVWVHAYNDDCLLDLDGTRVLEQGVPVSLWEWLGCQSLRETC